MAFSYVSTGRMPQMTSVMSLGLISYSYNPSIVEQFLYLDFGSVSLNYWVIENHANVVIEDFKDIQLLNLTEDGSVNSSLDLGLITQVEAVGTEDWGLITVSSNITTFGFTHFESLSTWSVIKAWEGTGQIFEFGGSIYRLNAPWIGSGTLRLSGDTITNYVPNVTTRGLLPLRGDTRIAFAPNWNAFGSITIDISSSNSTSRRYEGFADLNVDNAASIIASLHHIGSGSLFTINNAVSTVTFDYVGTGSLFTLQSAEETVTWHYNPSSVVYFEYQDYGLVSEPVIDSLVIQDVASDTIQQYADIRIVDLVYPGSDSGDFIDHGSLLINNQDPPETLQIDWGYIWETYTKYPMGLGRISGEARYAYSPNWNSTGSISIFGAGRGRTNPIWKAFINISVFGEAKPNFSLLHVGSGTLFGLSNAEESSTFNYTGSGSLYAISGAAEAVGVNPPDITTDLKIFGDGSYRFAPNWISEGSIAIDVEHYATVVYSEVGSGTLFNFDSKVERRTYSYNPTSDFRFAYLDYGEVSEPVIDSVVIQDIANDTIQQYASIRIVDFVYEESSGTYFDYGLVSDPNPTITDDYEFIWQTVGRFAMGDLKISGASKTNFSLGHQTTGDITIFGTGRGRTNPIWKADIEIIVSGIADEKLAKVFIGSGDLYSIVSTTDSRSYDYEGSGSLYAISGGAESVGANPPDITTDIRILGEGTYRFAPNWNGEGLAVLSGKLVERTTYSEVGSGILYNFDSLVERRTYSYNLSSIDYLEHRDYGLVSEPAIDSIRIEDIANDTIQQYANDKIIDLTYSGSGGNYFDYGYLQQPLVSGLRGVENPPTITDDYQYILDSASIYPFGRLQLGLSSVDTKTIFSLLHIGNADGTQIKITGEVSVRLPNVFTGSGVLFAIEGAVERVAFSEVKEGLFTINGSAGEAYIPNWNAFGTIVVSGNAQYAVSAAAIKEGYIRILGEVSEVFTTSYAGTGSLYSVSGAAEAVGFNPPDITTDIIISGTLSERTTVSHVGFGNLFGVSGAVESYTIAESKKVLLDITGEASYRFAPNWNGSGDLFALNGAAESFTASPDDLQVLFNIFGFGSQKASFAEFSSGTIHISGTTEPEILTFAEQPEVIVSIFGDVSERYVPNWNGSGSLYAVSGAAEAVGVNPPDITTDLKISGTAEESFSFANYDGDVSVVVYGGIPKPPTLAFAESGVGVVQLSGIANVVNIDVYLAEGTIFSSGIVSESKTVKIPAFEEGIITIRGAASESASFNPPDITTRIAIFGQSEVPILTFVEQPVVRILTSGTAVERNTEAYFGSGTIFSTGISGESITRKLPAFIADIAILGAGTESISYREIFFGSLFTFRGSTEPEILTFAEQPEVQIIVSGDSTNSFTGSYVGTGFIPTLSGAAESVTFNPVEREALFRISGEVSDIKIVKSEVKQIEVRIDVETDFRFVPNWISEGTIPVRGDVYVTSTKDYVGTGDLYSIGGAAESITFNPDEREILFNIVGAAIEKNTESYVGSGTIFSIGGSSESRTVSEVSLADIIINGNSVNRIALSYIGTGDLYSIGGSAESVTFNPVEREALFGITGFATIRSAVSEVKFVQSNIFNEDVKVYLIRYLIGDGNISIDVNAAESKTKVYTGFGNLFTVSNADIKKSFAYEGDSSLVISGIATEKNTESYIGFGSFSAFEGAAESVTFIPAAITTDINLSGNAVIKVTAREIGTGSLFGFGGASESRTVSYNNVAAFEFFGASVNKVSKSYVADVDIKVGDSATISFVRAPYNGDGNIFTTGESVSRYSKSYIGESDVNISGIAVVTRIQRYEAYVNINVNGESIDNVAIVYTGRGSLFTLGNAQEVGPIGYWTGSGTVTISGFSLDKKVSVSPQRTYGWIV
jgi:hypothetical protein